jgi:Outer membrane protein beta-barrel domain
MFPLRFVRAPVFAVGLLAPAVARADVLLTPFVGGNVGGSAGAPLADFVGDHSRTTFGGSIAVMSAGIFGVEADIGYSPKFFGTDLELGGIPVSVARNNVLTAMANLTAGVPIQSRGGQGIRPYGVAGLGLLRQQFDLAGGLVGYSANDLAYDVGGGVMLFLGRNSASAVTCGTSEPSTATPSAICSTCSLVHSTSPGPAWG